MGGFIIVNVDRLDRNLEIRDLPVYDLNQHLCFILVAVAFQLRKVFETTRRDHTKAGLGIFQLDAAGKSVYIARDLISKSASRRNIGTVKISAADDHKTRVCFISIKAILHGLGRMLTVSITGDPHIDIRPLFQKISEGRFQPRAFSFVDFMCQYCNLRMFCRFIKEMHILRSASVIYNYNILISGRN